MIHWLAGFTPAGSQGQPKKFLRNGDWQPQGLPRRQTDSLVNVLAVLQRVALILTVRADTHIGMIVDVIAHGRNTLTEVGLKTRKDIQGSDKVKADRLEAEENRHRNGDRLPRHMPPCGSPQQPL